MTKSPPASSYSLRIRKYQFQVKSVQKKLFIEGLARVILSAFLSFLEKLIRSSSQTDD